MPQGILVSLEEYLGNPDYAHFEYEAGEVVEKPMGTKQHGQLQGRFFMLLNAFAEAQGLYLGTELHCELKLNGQTAYRLPDVAMSEASRFNEGNYHVGAPTLAIEILSPEDRMQRVLEKARDYFANGSQLVWVVDPAERNVMVVYPDRVPRIFDEGEELSGAPVWPELKVDLAKAFRGI
jgi:Uma2 family endonuclease